MTKTKQQQAVKRKRAFVDAIELETYGKCPKPPTHGGLLKDMISSFVRVRDGAVIVYDLQRWSIAEIEYALCVVKQLGHKATWT